MKESALFYLPAIANHGLFQGGSGLAWRSEQGLHKPSGLPGIKLNLIALADDLAGRFTDVRNDKLSHRPPLDRGRSLDQLFIRRRYPGGESLTFSHFCYRRHRPNVRPRGTHCKS